ncbi:hypothetical protein [Paraburkholderia bannensis]|uniref:hypothetical protein n=1 Tax=Paraburkholderia bannensis TaxID=765414 RepID=UPI002AB69762|nr:hypothetical protein [Paraburkholderia bannensis]
MDTKELKPGHCHKCGLALTENPHPEAGKPDHVLNVGCPKECIPCLTLSRHSWYTRAMKAESELRDALPSDAAQAPKAAVPKDLIEARAQGRAEALALLLDIDPDTFCGEYIVDGGSLPSGDRSEDWDAEKLRELLRADDSAYSLMQSAEAEYWRNVGLRDDIEQMHKRVKADQKPTAWVRFRSDGGFEGPIMDTDARMCDTRRSFWTPLYADPVAPAAVAPINLEGLRKKLLTPRKILRDENGWLSHPDYPICDEGTNADAFLSAFGIETWFRSMESDLPDFSERYHEEGLSNCSEWTPTAPAGEGWLLLGIYDTEDGPCAMFGRDQYEAENALKRQRMRELSARIQQRQADKGAAQ